MPNRYVKEDAIESERVNNLSWQGEVFYRRLLNRVDDFGRYTAHPELLRAKIFPLQLVKVSASDVEKLLLECEQSALISRWTDEANGKAYLAMHKWEQGRASESKYPEPPPPIAERLKADANGCLRLQTKTLDSDPDNDPDSDTDGINKPPRARERSQGPGPTLDDVLAWASMDGVQRELAELFWNHYESVGWVAGENVIVKPRNRLAVWASNAREKIHKEKMQGKTAGRGFWQAAKELELVRGEIKKMWEARLETANGWQIDPKHKTKFEELKKRERELKKELGL